MLLQADQPIRLQYSHQIKLLYEIVNLCAYPLIARELVQTSLRISTGKNYVKWVPEKSYTMLVVEYGQTSLINDILRFRKIK